MGVGLVAALALSLLPHAAQACGPYYATPLLGGYGADPSDVPEARFQAEVADWVKRSPPDYPGKLIPTVEGDSDDAAHLIPPGDLDAYREARAQTHELSADLPAELVLYQRGVVAMHEGRLEDARSALRSVLELPEEQRQYRATWAAYMLGALEPDVAARVRALRRVRTLVDEGHHDTLGLALASLRREVDERPETQAAARLDACAAYVHGGGTLACAGQLATLAELVLADPSARVQAARAPNAAAIVTLALTSRDVWQHAQPDHKTEALDWLRSMKTSPHAQPWVGRLAWIAYAIGEPDEATQWILRASPEDHIASWIQGKIQVERGELDAAGASFARASTALQAHTSCDHHHHRAAKAVQVELGIVRMAQDRPVEAMEHFLAGADWMDAAWVGERVLTTAELQALVDRRAPRFVPFDMDDYATSGGLPMLSGGQDLDPRLAPALLRGLLGRRLVREGRLAEARPYLPPSAHAHLDQVMRDLALGESTTASDAVRGGALWRAAFTLKMQGWALSATELEPDQRVLGGWFPGAETQACRDRTLTWCQDWEGLAPTDEERRRRAEHASDERRYHFVYTSDELARKAMALMPDDHPDLPQAACVTGHWMRNRDAKKSWRSWRILQDRTPDHPLAEILSGRSGWWQVRENGLCGLPDGSPLPDEGYGCSAVGGGGAGWLGVLGLLLGWRRRRATVQSPL